MSEDVLDRLFAQAREVVLGDRDQIDVSIEELTELVSDEVKQARFRSRFRLEAQNDETRELILILLKGMGTKALEIADLLATDADGLDNYVGRPGIGITAAAVAMLVATVGLGPLLLLSAGLIGMAGGGFGANVLRKRANRLRALGSRVKALTEDLKDV